MKIKYLIVFILLITWENFKIDNFSYVTLNVVLNYMIVYNYYCFIIIVLLNIKIFKST